MKKSYVKSLNRVLVRAHYLKNFVLYVCTEQKFLEATYLTYFIDEYHLYLLFWVARIF